MPQDSNAKTAGGLLLLLEIVFKDTWALENSVARSRTLAYLGQVLKGMIEVGELEARVAALEQELAKRMPPRLRVVK